MHGDGSLDAADMRRVLEAAIERAGSVANFSRNTGLDRRHISDARHAKRAVSDKIARSIGFTRADLRFVRYIPIDAEEADAGGA